MTSSTWRGRPAWTRSPACSAGAPQLRIVVTARARLQLRAEHVLEIGGLPYPAHGDDPAARHFAAVQLFVRRAQQQHDAFALSAHNRAAVLRICQAVDGMPLALELAAAWTRSLAPEEILTEIERGIDFLSTTMRDAPPRHRSMRVVFTASWQMLTPQEQQVFAAAAVFRGGFDARPRLCRDRCNAGRVGKPGGQILSAP